jgi:hypothetical protein
MMRNMTHTSLVSLLLVALVASCHSDSKPVEEDNGSVTETPSEPVTLPDSPVLASFDDGLVATDGLGRTLPDYSEVGGPNTSGYVGLFYWLWHGSLRNENTDEAEYNVTLSNARDPKRTNWQFADYYWAKPELGYYRSVDKFVMQKHINLFCLLGIDFLYLDFTNVFADPDAEALTALLEVIRDFKAKGFNPPKLVPFFNAGLDGPNKDKPYSYMEKYYNSFVKSGEYADCWFVYEGKPLILAPVKHDKNAALNNAFTWRQMWAAFPASVKDRWRFFDSYVDEPKGPHPAYRNGQVEQMAISKGIGGPIWENMTYGGGSSTTSHVPSYNEYLVDPENTGRGLFFEEQASKALQLHPKVLCITGWNEWKAGAWPADESLANAKMKFRGEPVSVGTYYFVDEFNEEFNRDFEPQENPEYSDNFYYQLAAFMRRYKGMKAPEKASASKTIDVASGAYSAWSDVGPVFRDFEGDLRFRNCDGSPRGVKYTDYTKRNDIVESRVTYDADNVYFYVKTADVMSIHTGTNWMLLYIDADKDKSTGWEGYDFSVNMEVKSATKTVLKKRVEGKWVAVADCDYRYDDNQMQIAVPRSALTVGEKPSFYFHWTDNVSRIDNLNDFFTQGESAPERRYNYFYDAI